MLLLIFYVSCIAGPTGLRSKAFDDIFVPHLHINIDVTHNEDFLDVSPTTNIARAIESRRMR